MQSSVKTHGRARRVKPGPRLRVKKHLRVTRAQDRVVSQDRWLADFLGVRRSALAEWTVRDPWGAG